MRVGAAVACAVAAALPASAAGAGASDTVYAVAGGNLIRFDSDAPGTILSSVPITGQGGDNLVGLDFRPATGELYATGVNGSSNHLYRIDPETAVAAPVETMSFSPGLVGAAFGMDFNPVVDRIRSVSDTDQNMRLNPTTGLVSFVDTDLAYTSGGANPNVVALAYTNNVAGAATTTLYAIDSAADTLVRIGGPDGDPSPNLGQLTTIGALGFGVSGSTGFDIAPGGRAYFTAVVGGTPLLGTVDIGTGRVTSTHVVGGPVSGMTGLMAVGLGGELSFAATTTAVRESAGSATLTINRAAGVGAASVDYATSDATAAAGPDYTATSGTVTLEFGEDTKTVSVPIANDAVPEEAEALTVTLSNAKLGSLGPTATAAVVIDDDDVPSAAPVADRSAPAVLLGATTGRLTRAFTVPYSCSEACRATFELRPARRERRRFRLAAVNRPTPSSLTQAGKAKARIAVTRAARRRLRRVRSLVVTLRATVTDAAGNRTVESTKVRLRR